MGPGSLTCRFHVGERYNEDSPLPEARHAYQLKLKNEGGKGLHAWFLAEGRPEQELRAFFALAVECGGDPVLWGRSQFVRIPDGLRESGAMQRAYYFNREVLS